MKIILLSLLVILSTSTLALAGTVVLQWDANQAADQVTSYNVYRDGVKALSVAGNVNTATVANIPNGSHTFYVTAQNAWAESGPSNTVSTPPLPGAPTNAKITITVTVSP